MKMWFEVEFEVPDVLLAKRAVNPLSSDMGI